MNDIQPAGPESPHLDDRERTQAARGAPMGPLVIHEIVRAEGEKELQRSFSGLAWSGLAAGLSIGFSFMVQAMLQGAMPDAPWRKTVASFGYAMGFLIVILGRQQLFTETTLTALIPTLTRRTGSALIGTLRVWTIVLAANIAGSWLFAAAATIPDLFESSTVAAMSDLSAKSMAHPFVHTVVTGGSAGWLIGVMVWLLPGAGPARPLIIILLTYVVALGEFPHIIAGSVEAAYGVCNGQASFGDYLAKFFVPTLIGNSIGGTILAALLNHAPIADEIGAGRGNEGEA